MHKCRAEECRPVTSSAPSCWLFWSFVPPKSTDPSPTQLSFGRGGLHAVGRTSRTKDAGLHARTSAVSQKIENVESRHAMPSASALGVMSVLPRETASPINSAARRKDEHARTNKAAVLSKDPYIHSVTMNFLRSSLK